MDYLNILKLHALVHYMGNCHQLGIPDNFLTKAPESLHICMCKEPYKSTNRRDYDCQILNYLDVQDQLTLPLLYEVFKDGEEVNSLHVPELTKSLTQTIIGQFWEQC